MPIAEHRKDKGKHYGRRWQALRSLHLRAHPLCAMCLQAGAIVPATVVHHKDRHQGDLSKLYDPTNLESLCKRHHDSDAQKEERAEENAKPRIGADGYPTDGSWL